MIDLFLFLINHHAINMYRGVEELLHVFFKLTLDTRCVWSASGLGAFTPMKRAPDTQWVGPRASKKKNPLFLPGIKFHHRGQSLITIHAHFMHCATNFCPPLQNHFVCQCLHCGNHQHLVTILKNKSHVSTLKLRPVPINATPRDLSLNPLAKAPCESQPRPS